MSNRIAFCLLVAAVTLVSCGPGPGVGLDGGSVGGSCVDDRDCDPEAKCLRGGDFPGGTCALPCGGGEPCPGGTVCVDEKGGYCLLTCANEQDCRAGYDCDRQKIHKRHGGGRERVCIDD